MPTNSFSHHREFHNDGADPRLLMIEPIGEDYWIAPGSTLVFWFSGEEASFHIVENEDMFAVERGEHITAIYPPDCYDWAVYQDNQRVECGHNRPVGWGQALQSKYDEIVENIQRAYPEIPEPPTLPEL